MGSAGVHAVPVLCAAAPPESLGPPLPVQVGERRCFNFSPHCLKVGYLKWSSLYSFRDEDQVFFCLVLVSTPNKGGVLKSSGEPNSPFKIQLHHLPSESDFR
jgi:hypothetical protein